MKKSSIYPNRSQELLTLFEKAGNPSKLICVPIDYAKKDHLVMFCNGNGEVGPPVEKYTRIIGLKVSHLVE
jgi:hypothetical protein